MIPIAFITWGFVMPKLNRSGCNAIDFFDPQDEISKIPNIKISNFFIGWFFLISFNIG